MKEEKDLFFCRSRKEVQHDELLGGLDGASLISPNDWKLVAAV